MRKQLYKWQILSFVFTSVVGTLLHFLYDLSGQSIITAPFSAVNESTWEHMKLLFIPMFIIAIIQSFYIGKDYESYWCIKLMGTLLGLIIIPVLFYTYTGIFGVSVDWFNIAIFFISAASAYVYETRMFSQEKECLISSKVAFFILCLLALAFIVFTFVQPKIPLFQDPTTFTYGIAK